MRVLCRRRPHARGGSERRLAIALVLLLQSGCTAPAPYLYDTERQVLMMGDKRIEGMRIVSKDKALIPPVEFGQWFIPSHWAIKLAERWADLPHAFEEKGPEYCAALGVDKDRMLHVSAAVRYRDPKKAKESCPGLIWLDDDFMIALSNATHNHSTPEHHGEGISLGDAIQGSPMLVSPNSEPRIEMSRVAVHFGSGERLMGVNPETGAEAPVPAQSLLLTRCNGAPHVFLWIPLAAQTEDRSHFVRVYKPVPDDGWEAIGTCWVDASQIEQAEAFDFQLPAHCGPADLWFR